MSRSVGAMIARLKQELAAEQSAHANTKDELCDKLAEMQAVQDELFLTTEYVHNLEAALESRRAVVGAHATAPTSSHGGAGTPSNPSGVVVHAIETLVKCGWLSKKGAGTFGKMYV